EIVPDLVLRDLMLHRLFRKYQADAGAVLYSFRGVIAVVDLELQIGSGWDSQCVTGRPGFCQMARQVDSGNDIQISRGHARNSATGRIGTAIVGNWRVG